MTLITHVLNDPIRVSLFVTQLEGKRQQGSKNWVAEEGGVQITGHFQVMVRIWES